MGLILLTINKKKHLLQLIGWVNDSDADFVILGGDLNTNPPDNETGYRNLQTAMVNSMEEFFLDKQVWKTSVQVFPNHFFSGGLAQSKQCNSQ